MPFDFKKENERAQARQGRLQTITPGEYDLLVDTVEIWTNPKDDKELCGVGVQVLDSKPVTVPEDMWTDAERAKGGPKTLQPGDTAKITLRKDENKFAIADLLHPLCMLTNTTDLVTKTDAEDRKAYVSMLEKLADGKTQPGKGRVFHFKFTRVAKKEEGFRNKYEWSFPVQTPDEVKANRKELEAA